MGVFLSRTWFIYARDANDKWMEPLTSTLTNEDDIEHHMGRFKHYVFLLALGKLDECISKIYLYRHRRVARCEIFEEELRVDFSSKEAMDAWNSCKRSKQGRKFDSIFSFKEQGDYSVTFTRCPDLQSAEY